MRDLWDVWIEATVAWVIVMLGAGIVIISLIGLVFLGIKLINLIPSVSC